MKSLEKLRTVARNMAKGRNLENHEECNLLLVLANEIQAEVDERFMLLPVDADGVPIRIGDLLECSEYGNQTERFTVYGYTTEYSTWTGDIATLMATNENATEFYCDRCHHVNPRTVEDVLRDLMDGIDSVEFDALIEIDRAAAEIRELLGGGGL